MSIQSKPFYWVTCDQDGGCDKRSPEEDEETVAWSEEDQAISAAEGREWLIVGSKHYCEDHAPDQEQELPLEEQQPLPMPNIADTCCGKCTGGTCYVDQITGA